MESRRSHTEEDLILYFYDELDDDRRQEIDALLSVSPELRAQFAALQQLESDVPRQPSVSVSDEALEAIRGATARRLAAEAMVSRSAPLSQRMTSWLSAPQWATFAVALVLVFVAGRLSGPGQDSNRFVPQSSGSLASIAPADISDIEIDPSTGIVQITYQESRPVMIAAEVTDSRVQSLLSGALLNAENPGSRLRAVRAVSEADFMGVRPDPTLVQAMENVLETEQNEGIRLQTLKAISSLHAGFPVSPELKDILIGMMTSERNPALRLEALNLLTNSELAELELQSALQDATRDVNPFIRRQAEALLSGSDESMPLESLEGMGQ